MTALQIKCDENWTAFTYELASVDMDGSPSNTTTRSAKYVAIMKSCSTTNAVFFACKINLKRKH